MFTQELSPTAVLSLLETTKEQRQTFVSGVIHALKEGGADPLKIHLQVKNTEDLVKQITGSEEYKSLCLDEAQKYGRSFERYNAKFEVKEVGIKYDYAVCSDPVLSDLQTQADTINAKLKSRQDWLKKAPIEGVTIVDESSGETIKVYPPAKSSTTSVTVTLK